MLLAHLLLHLSKRDSTAFSDLLFAGSQTLPEIKYSRAGIFISLDQLITLIASIDKFPQHIDRNVLIVYIQWPDEKTFPNLLNESVIRESHFLVHLGRMAICRLLEIFMV